MRSILTRISLLSLSLFLLISTQSQAAPEKRIALVIGNGNYESSPLLNPVNDATDMAASLKKLGFNVILKTNAAKRDMGKAVEDFGKRLKGGDVGLFYYAGHGVQVNGVNYLIPVGAKINEETDVEYEAIDAGRILAKMYNAKSSVNIVILDACRDNPYVRSFRSATRGLAIISKAPSGTIISFSTSPGDVALDGKGRNSPYTSALIQYMNKPGLSIEDVFKNVRRKLRKETGQVPWELSSLEGKFYFTTPSVAALESSEPEEAEKPPSSPTRDKIEVAKVAPSPISAVNEIGRDNRFIAYDDGTVLDTSTNLMWAAKDNGSDINWANAKNYCENYRGGGHTDWRMPMQDELAELYDGAVTNKNAPTGRCSGGYHITNLIHLTCGVPWASETRGSGAASFNFSNGKRLLDRPSGSGFRRALPVRSGK